MSDLISRQAAIAYAISGRVRIEDGEKWIRVSEVRESLSNMPSAEPERKNGKWIRNDNSTYSCSACHSWIPEEQHFYARYCLYCGAEMDGER